MLSQSIQKMWMLAGVAMVLLVAAVWLLADQTLHEARADDASLRDPAGAEPPSMPHVIKQSPQLASIPWKRDTDHFAAVSIREAQLPWLRDAPSLQVNTSAASGRTQMLGRSSLAAPKRNTNDQQLPTTDCFVFLPTAELPWRY
jgi:hypothetical protein